MKILVCDRCGKTKRILTGIYEGSAEEGYRTLAQEYQTEALVDVCNDCYKLANEAQAKARKDTAGNVAKAVKAALEVK